jgi:uncharacterized UBP type Zn finger protein
LDFWRGGLYNFGHALSRLSSSHHWMNLVVPGVNTKAYFLAAYVSSVDSSSASIYSSVGSNPRGYGMNIRCATDEKPLSSVMVVVGIDCGKTA